MSGMEVMGQEAIKGLAEEFGLDLESRQSHGKGRNWLFAEAGKWRKVVEC